MSHPTNELIAEMKQEAEQERLIKLGQESGLAFTGDFKEGLPEFIGDDKAWSMYDRMLEHKEESMPF